MIFDCLKGKAKHDEDVGEGASNCPSKKQNKQWREGSLVAVADCKGVRKPAEGTPDHFEKLLEGPCSNHAFPIKHLYKDYVLMKRFLSESSNKGEHRGTPSRPQTSLRGMTAAFRHWMAAS